MYPNKWSPYILQELDDLTEAIHYPLKCTQRIKYTCFDVSKNLIAFGATSGGIYIFNRNPCEFIQLIPNKDGAITRLSISPDEKLIAFVNGHGVVTITECAQTLSGGHKTVSSRDHSGDEVTALVWGANNLVFCGDDVGKVSMLDMPNFITPSMFQNRSQTIMSLDSRICQLDSKDVMLLVSTLTRCYICDTSSEQYRQIGQKLRDGEFGACFLTKEKTNEITSVDIQKDKNVTESKGYNIVSPDGTFAVNDKLINTVIYCARPSSRLWEASIDGSVVKTHQFKQVLGKNAAKIISKEAYENEKVELNMFSNESEGQSCSFPKISSINNSAIFSYKKDAVYFLNVENVDDTIWFDNYKDIADCKMFNDHLYIWAQDGNLKSLRFMKIDKYLVKCYLDEKYVVCSDMCALFKNYLLENNNLSPKLHILIGLKEKLVDKSDVLKRIEDVLEKIDAIKIEATQMKSGIYVVDNTYNAQSLIDDEMIVDDNSYSKINPEALYALKGISSTVTGHLSTSKKILKETWEDIEEKFKHLGNEKPLLTDIEVPKRIYPDNGTDLPLEYEKDVIYNDSSQKSIEIDDELTNEQIIELDKLKLCKYLYQHYRLSVVGENTEYNELVKLLEDYSDSTIDIYELMSSLQQYCIKVDAVQESKYIPHYTFLTYITHSAKKDLHIDNIIENELLYQYFVDSVIKVNLRTGKITNVGCECGFPLPYNSENETPVFPEIIDLFLEKQWAKQTEEESFDICKRMPYLWRKILYLRRNDDLMSLLRILLQMLDEDLLRFYLPKFKIETWDKAIQLYATLSSNTCLNCNRKFDSKIAVKNTLSWDDFGALILKSIGGMGTLKVLETHSKLIATGDLTTKFYHTCLLVSFYEKFDGTLTSQLTDALYACYGFDDVRNEVCKLLRNTSTGQIKNTALPIIIAANSSHWGLKYYHKIPPIQENITKNLSISDIIENLSEICDCVVDCTLCGLPLANEVLIKDGGLWTFKCGHTFHGACLDLNQLKLCPSCSS